MTLGQAISTLSTPDHLLMRRLNRWRPPRLIRWWMITATRGGDGWIWVFCGTMLALWGDARRFDAILAASLAISAGVLMFQAVKKQVGRKRPCHIEPHCWARLLPPDQFSFPSGHSITAFAAAVSIGQIYPGLLPLLLFCAASVALSRIVLGMHFLSDILAGSAAGALLGYGAFLIVAI